MSWVTDVILIFNLEENFAIDNRFSENVPPLDNINVWLKDNDFGSLKNIGACAGGGKAMQSNVYGGAFNYLKVDEFIGVVKSQAWREPEDVQLLLQDEEESRFILHTLTS